MTSLITSSIYLGKFNIFNRQEISFSFSSEFSSAIDSTELSQCGFVVVNNNKELNSLHNNLAIIADFKSQTMHLSADSSYIITFGRRIKEAHYFSNKRVLIDPEAKILFVTYEDNIDSKVRIYRIRNRTPKLSPDWG